MCVPLVAFWTVRSPQLRTSAVIVVPGSEQVAVAVTKSGAGPLLGETESEHDGGFPKGLVAAVIETVALADFVGSAMLVAVTFAVLLAVTVGAV